MVYIVSGRCRQCGCSGFKESLEGDNCYTCGHVEDLHEVEYMPSVQKSSTASTSEVSPLTCMTEATIDLPQEEQLKEKYPQGAPGICFEDTVAASAADSKSDSSKSLLQTSLHAFLNEKKTQTSTSDRSSVCENPLTQTSPESPEKKAPLSTLLLDSPRVKLKQSPGKVTPKKRRSADVFESPAPYNGQKPACWRLMMSHLPYGMEPPEGIKGPYKIAEKGQTIYVGNATKVPIAVTLAKKFKGKDKQCIGAYLSTLTEEEREKDITLFWVDESEVDHSCQCTYLKCFERMEGKKPKLNMAGVRGGKTEIESEQLSDSLPCEKSVECQQQLSISVIPK